MPSRSPVTLVGLARASVVLVGLASLAGWFLPFWPFELCSHFPLHLGVLLLLVAGLLAARREWRWVAGAVVLAAIHGGMVASALRAGVASNLRHRPASADQATFSVASLNVYFKGERYADTAAFLLGSKAEVVVLVEVTPEWVDQLAILRTRWPHVVAEPRDGSHGLMLLSKLPILDHDTIDLSDGGRVTLRATLKTSRGPVTLIAFHPPPPTTPGRALRRNVEMRAVAELVRAIEGPRLLVGDFNCSPWSPLFRRLVTESGLRDSREGRGLQATWPSLLGPLGIPIDHALVSPDLRVVNRSVGPRVGSDHRGIVVRLALDPVDDAPAAP